jgi:hypothetical protein
MRPIPSRMRQELEALPRMRRCTLWPVQDLYGACSGRLRNPEWHHVWTYGGPQINELWAILAACTYHHDEVKAQTAVKNAFESASIMLATEEDLAKYPRKDWSQIMKSLGILKLWQQKR